MSSTHDSSRAWHDQPTIIYSLPPVLSLTSSILLHQSPTTTRLTNDHHQMDPEKLFSEKSFEDTAQYFVDDYSWNFGHFAAFCDRLLGYKGARKMVEGLWCSHLKRICEFDEDKKRRDKASSLLPVSVFPTPIYWNELVYRHPGEKLQT